MCLVGVVVGRYIDFLILLIPTLLSFATASLLFHLNKILFVLVPVLLCNLFNNFFHAV